MGRGRDTAVVIGVDTGGTFTDLFASDGTVRKVPSTPADPVRAILQAVRSVDPQPEDAVGHGTTVATNAVLERKGAKTSLITTEGFEDVLEIRRQNRPSLYDLRARWPEPLVPVERRIGLRERLEYTGNVLVPLDASSLAAVPRRLRDLGTEAVAVCFLHAYANPQHERTAGGVLAVDMRGVPISLSHQVAPRYGEYERTSTTVINAYVMPVMRRYLEALEEEAAALGLCRLHLMHSNGGLIDVATAAAHPVRTILSGPAAGVVGGRALAERAGHNQIITFDMGGTSTDVAVVPGEVLERSDGEIASFPLLVPMLTIETVGAGGGSIARLDAAGGLHVGPESAGAEPGPAAYGRGELPTVTDANLILGRLSPDGLLGGDMPLNEGRARAAVSRLASGLGMDIEQAAWAIIRLTNSNMERAVRAVTLQRGYDPRRFTLCAFGGAGPLHAAELAEGLGIETVLAPPHPGVMAALGLTVPDLVRDFSRTVLQPLTAESVESLQRGFGELESEALAATEREDRFGDPVLERFVDARYAGQSFELRLPFQNDAQALRDDFNRAHAERYGYATVAAPVEMAHIHLRIKLPRLRQPSVVPPWPEPAKKPEERDVWFGSGADVSEVRPRRSQVLWRPSLPIGAKITGPAVLRQYDSTTVVPPTWAASVDRGYNLVLRRSS